MRKVAVMVIGIAMVGAAACGRDGDRTLGSDTALSRDLDLASQVRPGGLDSLSAFETNSYADPNVAAGYVAAPASAPVAAPAPTARRASSSPRRTRASTSARDRSRATSRGDVGVRSEGRVVVERNTKRDAAIGAAAGAVIGAATSRNKVKGAVIGGVAGGVIGGIIGHTVDVKKKRVP